MIETLDDIVMETANKLGIYGAHKEDDESCSLLCRACWEANFKHRIISAIYVEQKLGLLEDPYPRR